jgi:hypothetical protein
MSNVAKKFSCFTDLTTYVLDEGFVTISAGHLRDLCGHARLGIKVRLAISTKLEELGITHFPDLIPDYQHIQLRLYKIGSAIELATNAILHPSAGNDALLKKIMQATALAALQEAAE